MKIILVSPIWSKYAARLVKNKNWFNASAWTFLFFRCNFRNIWVMYCDNKVLIKISFVVEKHKRTLALAGGNFTAGAVAQMSGLEPVAQFGYGAYNMTGNSKWLTGLVTGVVGLTTLINPPVGLGAAYLIGKYGEDKLTQRSIGLGKQFIKRK